MRMNCGLSEQQSLAMISGEEKEAALKLVQANPKPIGG